MKFLSTKVKQMWLSSEFNREKVINAGLTIRNPFIGIEIKKDEPSKEELEYVENAIESLFGNHKRAFPIRLIDL